MWTTTLQKILKRESTECVLGIVQGDLLPLVVGYRFNLHQFVRFCAPPQHTIDE